MRKRINPEIYVYTLSYAYTFWGGAEAHLLDANIVGALSDDGRTHREPSEGKATVAQAKPPWEGASPTQKNNKIDGTWSYVFSLGTFYRDAPELGGWQSQMKKATRTSFALRQNSRFACAAVSLP